MFEVTDVNGFSSLQVRTSSAMIEHKYYQPLVLLLGNYITPGRSTHVVQWKPFMTVFLGLSQLGFRDFKLLKGNSTQLLGSSIVYMKTVA